MASGWIPVKEARRIALRMILTKFSFEGKGPRLFRPVSCMIFFECMSSISYCIFPMPTLLKVAMDCIFFIRREPFLPYCPFMVLCVLRGYYFGDFK